MPGKKEVKLLENVEFRWLEKLEMTADLNTVMVHWEPCLGLC